MALAAMVAGAAVRVEPDATELIGASRYKPSLLTMNASPTCQPQHCLAWLAC